MEDRMFLAGDDEVVDMDKVSQLDESTVVETDEDADEEPDSDIDDDESDDETVIIDKTETP